MFYDGSVLWRMRDCTGQYQCIVQLSEIPAVICYSTGPTSYEAHSMAAHNALQYLKIMTRKVQWYVAVVLQEMLQACHVL